MSRVMNKVKAIGAVRALRMVATVADAIADAAEGEPDVRAERASRGEVKLFGRRVPVRAAVELVRSLRRAKWAA